MADVVETQKFEIPVSASLPMSDMFQAAFIGHIVQEPKIYMQVAHRVKPDWFADSRHNRLYSLIQTIAARVGRPPTQTEILGSKEFMVEGPHEQQQIRAQLEKSLQYTSQIRWDTIRTELTDWLQSKILQETILKTSGLWNKKQWKAVAALMQQAVTEFGVASFEEGREISFENPELYLRQKREDNKSALPTGLPLLDEALLDGAVTRDPQTGEILGTTGGLQRGDTTVVLAPSNIGKTTFLLTIARHNIMSGNAVLLMTHEGRPADIRNKLLKACLCVSEEEMLKMYETPEGLAKLNHVASIISKNCVYIPYNKAGMTIEDVTPIIRRAQEERVAKYGKGFDLLVSDYPAKLTTAQAYAGKGALALRTTIEIVYEYYVQLALEYNFHALLAIQTNREGSKVNRGDDNHRLLRMEDVMEAWGPMTSASNVITLNRSPIAQRADRIIAYVCKSRSAEVGRAIVARTAFRVGLTHAHALGSTGYFGEDTLEGSIENYIKTHNGKIIPPELVLTLMRGARA